MKRLRVRLAAGLCALLAVVPLSGGALPASADDGVLTYEAEDGVLNGVQVETSLSGFSGTGYVGGFDTSTDSVTITIPDADAGLYSLGIRYAAPYGQKNATLQLNGAGLGEVTLTPSDTFTSVSAGKVLLKAGENIVTVVNNWAGTSSTPSPSRRRRLRRRTR